MTVSGKFMLDLVHLTHPPTTKQTDDAVLAEGRTGLKTVVGIAHETNSMFLPIGVSQREPFIHSLRPSQRVRTILARINPRLKLGLSEGQLFLPVIGHEEL